MRAKRGKRLIRESCRVEEARSSVEAGYGDVSEALRLARRFGERNCFLSGLLYLKQQYVNYGASIRVDGKELPLADRMAVEKYVSSVISEWLLLDNVVSFWRSRKGVPILLPAESCRYTDALGVPSLQVNLSLNSDQLRALPDEERRRYASEVRLSAERGEFFEVLTRAARGRGFGMPRLASLFRACTQSESMEIGEMAIAYAGRCVIRMHSLGWEVRANTGIRQADAMWTRQRAEEIEKKFQDANMHGVRNATANFDHKINHIWALNEARLDGARWQSVWERMRWWGGPLAFMLTAKTLNPDLLPAFKTEVLGVRAELKTHLEYVIGQALKARTVDVRWGNGCFANPKLFWDMLKTLMEQGPLPLAAALRAADVDPEEAAAEKLREARDAERQEKYLPLFDRSHGKRPAEPGRPQGARTGEGESV